MEHPRLLLPAPLGQGRGFAALPKRPVPPWFLLGCLNLILTLKILLI